MDGYGEDFSVDLRYGVHPFEIQQSADLNAVTVNLEDHVSHICTGPATHDLSLICDDFNEGPFQL